MKQPKHPLVTLDIEYMDGKGRITKRIIDITGPDSLAGIWINAYCRMREGLRSFYPDRILNCTDVNTGETIPDVVEYLKTLCGSSINLVKIDTKSDIEQPDIREYMREVGAFCKGLLADGVLYDQEILALQMLFARCPADTPTSINVVLDLLEVIQEDGIITAEEHTRLLVAVENLTN